MGYTIAEKILLAHTDKRDIKPGDFILAKIDLTLGNDITAPIAIKEFLKSGYKKVFDSDKIVLVPDHFLPAKDKDSANQAKILRDFAKRFKIKNFFEIGRMGIEHALLPELGKIFPGDLIIGADSHTCTYGALGAAAFGVGSTDLAFSWVKGLLWFRVPKTIKFIYNGKLRKWISGKDIILYTISKVGVDGALYKVMEFTGEVIRNLGIDDRFTICNMAVEAGAKTGIIEPDDITFDYVKGVLSSQKSVVRKKLTTNYYLLSTELRSDRDAKYEKVYEFDISNLEPQVACPHSPGNVKPLSKLKDIKIDQVFIGSCTNGRISDLRIAAKILKGRKIKKGLRLIVIPATQKIYLQAVREGLAQDFIKAGGVFCTPTCGPCIGGHMGVLAEGETCLSTTNRNFIGRMGHRKSFVYLCSPAVAAASVIKGKITHPGDLVSG